VELVGDTASGVVGAASFVRSVFTVQISITSVRLFDTFQGPHAMGESFKAVELGTVSLVGPIDTVGDAVTVRALRYTLAVTDTLELVLARTISWAVLFFIASVYALVDGVADFVQVDAGVGRAVELFG
jgi:hypothetical protein